MDQDVKIDTTAIPIRRTLILKRAELPLSGKSVTDVKKGVTNKYQYWIDYQKIALTMRFVLSKAIQKHIMLMAPVHHIVQGTNVDPLKRNVLVLASSKNVPKDV